MKITTEELNNIPARSFKDVLKFNKFYLFGATDAAGDIKNWLQKYSKNIISYLDNSAEKQGTKYNDGIEIESPKILRDGIAPDTAVIIASAYQREITHQLNTDMGVPMDCVFPYISNMFEMHFGEESIINNLDNINWLIDRVYDDASKNFIHDLIIYRWSMNPLLLKNNPNQIGFYEYDDSEIVLKQGDVIIDCGAFIGDTADVFLRRINFDGHIFAIEPMMENFKVLEKWIHDCGYTDRITPIRCAVGKEIETVEISTSTGVDPKASLITNPLFDITEKVFVKPIDKILEIKQSNKIDMIKIDVEGYEPDVLKGAFNTINKFKPNLFIAGYHVNDHLWSLPKKLDSMGFQYNIRVGHHPGALYEAELYCSSIIQ